MGHEPLPPTLVRFAAQALKGRGSSSSLVAPLHLYTFQALIISSR
jgi:hypothetical protein